MKKVFVLMAVATTIIFTSGCGPSRVVVRERMSPPRYSQPLAPAPGYIWVSGEWRPRRGTYEYRRGYWVRQRPGHLQYVEGYWHARRGGWVWIPGYWRR